VDSRSCKIRMIAQTHHVMGLRVASPGLVRGITIERGFDPADRSGLLNVPLKVGTSLRQLASRVLLIRLKGETTPCSGGSPIWV